MYPTWKQALSKEFNKPYYKKLVSFVKSERETTSVYPPPNRVFEAFRQTSLEDTRVIILGQDPYHNEGQAHGLSFSVLPGVPLPPSLRNIFLELTNDVGFRSPGHGNLSFWARQGVLLLNSVLTVRAKSPGSHQGQGWERFTDAVIDIVAAKEDPCIFVLWGNPAKKKAERIDSGRHLIIESTHPSPLSASYGFFGSRPFTQVNRGLQSMGYPAINWQT